jgi:F-type H+-transporting ATPase subunit a
LVAAESSSIDALGQFKLTTALGPVGASVNFTQSNLMMVVACVIVLGTMYLGMRPKALVPGRLQALAESAYDGVMSMCIDSIGPEGRRFFPLIFTLFAFVLVGNLLGVWPYFFTFTSHIAVTLALAALVVVITTGVALKLHGLHFFSYFVPKGVPAVLLPLLVPIEILSYVSRLISLSVRLFANMMAGHVMLDVFGAFVIMLGTAGMLGGLHSLSFLPAVFSFSVNVILIGFELLVAALQAYVFAVLTCIYLHDAVHLH